MAENWAKKRLVLIVEDNADDETLTLRGLRGFLQGPETLVVRDGAEAVRYLTEESGLNEQPLPDLVLLDLKLPKLSGIEVLRRIRSDQKTACIPVVVLTSSDEERDIKECYANGANSYICKPIDYAKFIEVVQAVGSYWLTASMLPVGPCSTGIRNEA